MNQGGSLLQRVLERAPKHPLGMTTHYRTVAIVNYAVLPDVLRMAVPAALDLDLAGGRGFVTVVCADMVKMRPSPLPRAFGITYDQVVYRVPVRYRDEPGLFFLGSDAGHPLMVAAGAAFSMFGVRLSRTRITDADDSVTIDVRGRTPGIGFHAYLKVGPAAVALPTGSVFATKAEVKSFLVDRFVAFVPGVEGSPMRRVRVRRGTWDAVLPSAIAVRSDLLDGSAGFPAGSANFDNALVAREIPYHWYAAEVEHAPGRWRRPRIGRATFIHGEPMDRPGSLLYDEDCGLCVATASWLAARVAPSRLHLVAIPEAEHDARIAGMVHGKALDETIHFVRSDGAILTGARAILAAGRVVPRWGNVAKALDHRLGHAVLEPVYREIARHRRRIGRVLGLPAACPLPARPGEPRQPDRLVSSPPFDSD